MANVPYGMIPASQYHMGFTNNLLQLIFSLHSLPLATTNLFQGSIVRSVRRSWRVSCGMRCGRKRLNSSVMIASGHKIKTAAVNYKDGSNYTTLIKAAIY